MLTKILSFLSHLFTVYGKSESTSYVVVRPEIPTLGLDQVLLIPDDLDCPWRLSDDTHVLMVTSMDYDGEDGPSDYSEELTVAEALIIFNEENDCRWHPDLYIKSCRVIANDTRKVLGEVTALANENYRITGLYV